MDSSLTAKPRRQVSLIAGLAIVLIFVSGVILGTIPVIISTIGVGVSLVAWAYALVITLRARQPGWTILLVIGLILALALSAYAFIGSNGQTNIALLGVAQLGFFPLAFYALAFGSMGAQPVIERGLPAFFGGWGLLLLVIGGTLVGGAIGTNIGAGAVYITALGFHYYGVAGLLGLVAWVTGLVVSWRTKAWGWFALVVLLPAIGAFMFGLFGPTRQDVLMAQENARQRRAVGLG